MAELKETGALRFDFDGEKVELTEADLLIDVQQKPGYYSMAEGNTTIALDTNLTDALVSEGFVREVISKLQTMRKEADFVVTDHIHVTIGASAELEGILTAALDEISSVVLADSVTFGAASDGYAKDWDINGENVTMSVKKA